MHIIEEMVLFQNSQPVQHMELDTDKVQWSAQTETKPCLFLHTFLEVCNDNGLSQFTYWLFG